MLTLLAIKESHGGNPSDQAQEEEKRKKEKILVLLDLWEMLRKVRPGLYLFVQYD